MADGSALQNLRVIDLTDDTGRFATKLLAEAGAEVLRIGRGSPGVAMKGQAGERGGLLDWWYDGGKQRLELDLDSPEGQRQFKDLTTRADLLIETEPPGRLAWLGLDFPDLHALNPRLVHVSLTPFGRQGPRAHWQTSDLVAAALGGVLSVTGTPDAPLNGWGRQCFNTASFFAAICGLAGVYAARETGHGQHIDLSLHQSVISCTEQVLMFWFFHKMFLVAIAPRQASLHWTGAFKVAPCASGQVMVTPGAHMPVLVDWLDADGMAGDLKELDLALVARSSWPRCRPCRQDACTTRTHAIENRSKRQRPGPKRQQSYGLEQIFFACTGESRAVVYSAVSFSGFALTRATRGVGRGNDDQP